MQITTVISIHGLWKGRAVLVHLINPVPRVSYEFFPLWTCAGLRLVEYLWRKRAMSSRCTFHSSEFLLSSAVLHESFDILRIIYTVHFSLFGEFDCYWVASIHWGKTTCQFWVSRQIGSHFHGFHLRYLYLPSTRISVLSILDTYQSRHRIKLPRYSLGASST